MAAAIFSAAQSANAATITVTSNGDTIAVDGGVTLREAIASIVAGSNVNADVVAVGAYGTNDTINFNIGGGGVQTITLASNPPPITKPVTINGYTQPGAIANSNTTASGTNAALTLELSGADLHGGLVLTGGNSVVRGLVINHIFAGASGISVSSDGNTIAGNFLGTNPAGTAAAGTGGNGIDVLGNNNTFGGNAPADRNLISGNGVGIRVESGTTNNAIAGNLIGTNAAGTAAIANTSQGVALGGSANTVGGAAAAARNLISGNGADGVAMFNSGNFVRGNYIGTDITGSSAIPNLRGVGVAGTSMTVGGSNPGEGNLISGNGTHGVDITNQSPGGATIQGNLIGTNAAGTAAIGGHTTAGIEVSNFSNGNTVGGTPGGNVIAFGLGAGIWLPGTAGTAGTGDAIRGNSIYSNAFLGIKLNSPVNGAPTPNDIGDPDNGGNHLQNFPVITAASVAAGTLTVSGTLNSTASSNFHVDIFSSVACDPSGNGEGQSYLGSVDVPTDGTGNGAFGPTMLAIPAGQGFITATATDATTFDTSEFSVCFAAPVIVPPTIAKNFGAASILLNASTSLTFNLTNPNASSSLTGVGFTDSLPAGLVVSTPNGLVGSCGGGTITATAGSGTVSLATATLPASGSCSFSVNVTGTTLGTKNNTTSAVTSVEGGSGNTALASVVVAAPSPPTIAKAFGAASIVINASTSLTFTLTNPNASTSLTGIGFTDSLPAGLVVSTPNGLVGSCGGGTITATAGSGTVSLATATLPASGSCSFSVNVTGTTLGTKNNTTSNVTSVEGGNGNAASASIIVAAALPPTIAKAFGAATIAFNASTSLTFTLTNPNASSLTGVGFTDSLPAGLVVSTPNGLVGSCGGGTITATAGSGTVSLATATLPASGSCTFSVNVTATTAGAKNNTTSNVTSVEGGSGNTASASLTVNAPQPPTFAKSFAPAAIAPGGTTTLTFSIQNPNASTVLTGVAFTDTFPVGLVVATPNGLSNTCGGSVTAVSGSAAVSLANGTLAAGGTCAISVVVTAASAAVLSNTTGTISSVEGGTGGTASAILAVGVIVPAAIIPTLGQWALAVLSLLLFVSALVALRRRRR